MKCDNENCDYWDWLMTDNCSKGEPPNVAACEKREPKTQDLAVGSDELLADIENDPRFEGFIRAFWRRIEPYKNDYGRELPKELPIEFRCSMATAFTIFNS